jgi:HTH-type transcriptional regulator / antitoxin MqsA
MKNIHCPVCTTGELTFFKEPDEITYKGHFLSVEVEYSVCKQCGEEMILPQQIKRNDCRVRDAWRRVDGLLTGGEIVALREQLGLTQLQASQVFGGGQNAFSKYERGEVIQSEAMDKLMRLSLEKQAINVPHWLRKHAGFNDTESKVGYGNVIPFTPKSNRQIPAKSNPLERNDELDLCL